jgi:hypothetical protein
MATSPLSGLTRPSRICNKVDLPEPLGPITPMQSPSDTVKERFSKSGATPYFLDMHWALMIGGMTFEDTSFVSDISRPTPISPIGPVIIDFDHSSLMFQAKPATLQFHVIEIFSNPDGPSAFLFHHASEATRNAFAKWLSANDGARTSCRLQNGTKFDGRMFREKMCFGRGLMLTHAPVDIRPKDVVDNRLSSSWVLSGTSMHTMRVQTQAIASPFRHPEFMAWSETLFWFACRDRQSCNGPCRSRL